MSSVEGKWQYRQWLKHSKEWETARLFALGFDKMKCQGCEKVDPSNDAHHILYPNRWQDTKKKHLRVLCRSCHEKIHQLTTPAVYKTLRTARDDFFSAINEIRKSNNLPPLEDSRHTIEGEIKWKEALSRRNPPVKIKIGDELGILNYQLQTFPVI
jgi:hypothetical protein